MTDLVPVTAKLSAFREDVRLLEVPEGATLLTIVAGAIDSVEIAPYLQVYIEPDPAPIPSACWARIRPRGGHRVVIVMAPQGGPGGGAKILRTVAMVAVMAAALTIPGAAGLAAGSFGAAALTAGISLVGSLLVNALIPVQQAKLASFDSQRSPNYAIEGATNQARPYETVPRVLGRRRMVPPLGAKPYTERVGDDQYIRIVVIWGHGPLEVTSIRIGETAIEQIPGVQQQHCLRPGDGDPDLSLFPVVVHEDRQQLPLTAEDGWRIRTTEPDVTAILAEITAPTGLIRYSKNGKNKDAREVVIEYRYRPVGGAWSAITSITMSAETVEPVYEIIRVEDLAKGRYDFAIRRVTNDIPTADRQRIFDDIFWTVFQSFESADPIDAPGVARSAFRIKASELANGQLEISGIVQTLGKDWNGSTWVNNQPIRNPASLYRLVAQDRYANPDPRPDSKVNLADLQAWHAECKAKEWEFNAIIDFPGSEQEILSRIALSGRASYSVQDGKLTVVRDRGDLQPVQLFTPQNIVKGSFSIRKDWVRLPHGLRFRYDDEEHEWQQRELVVYADGYTKANATRFENAECFGVTNRAQIRSHGRWLLAIGVLRPETVSLTVHWGFLAARRGQRIEVQHDVPLWGVGSGRVIDRKFTGGGALEQITLSERIQLDGTPHEVRIIQADGDQFLHPIVTENGETSTLDFNPPLATGHPPLGGVVAVGKVGLATRSLVIKGVFPLENLEGARLECVDYAPGVHNADQVIGDFDPGITEPIPIRPGREPGLPRPVVDQVRSDETALRIGPDGTFVPEIVITLRPPEFSTDALRGLRVAWRPAGKGAWQAQTFDQQARLVRIPGVRPGSRYEISLRYEFVGLYGASRRQTKLGPIVGPFEHLVVGPNSTPPDVPALYLDGDLIRWDAGELPADHYGWIVKGGWTTQTPWAAAQSLHEGVHTANFFRVDLVPILLGAVLVKAVDRSGLESAVAKVVAIPKRDQRRGAYVLESKDFQAANFPGKLTNGDRTIDPETNLPLLEALGSSAFLPDDNAPFLPDDTAPFLADEYGVMIYEASWTIPADALASDFVTIEVVANAGSKLERRWGSDAFAPPVAQLPFLGGNNGGALPFLGGIDAEGAPFLSVLTGETNRQWIAWREMVPAVPGELMRIRVTTAAGAEQGRIAACRMLHEAPEITETQQNVKIEATRTRVKPRRKFRLLVWAQENIETPATAVYMRRFSKNGPVDAVDGPLLQIFTATGTPVTAIADITLGGY